MQDWKEFNYFMQQVQEAKDRLSLRPHQECFYRGHRDNSYKLQPSLFRQGDNSFEEHWKLERRMFFEFRSRARQLYNTENDDWDILFHMQHHGVPTRLLDWTSVFGVALYFALLDYDEKAELPPCIWLLNPYTLNHKVWGLYRLFSPKYLAREEQQNRSYSYSELLLRTCPATWNDWLGWKTPLAIYSHQRSERMFAQSGWFTIHGTDRRPIENIFLGNTDFLVKVDLPKEAIPAAREFLTFAGIGHRQLFPDLDGLARSVCAMFGQSR